MSEKPLNKDELRERGLKNLRASGLLKRKECASKHCTTVIKSTDRTYCLTCTKERHQADKRVMDNYLKRNTGDVGEWG